jgi:hypothetical protein
MKKVILFFAMCLNMTGYSQITLDIQNSFDHFSVINLTNSETKYYGNQQGWENQLNQFSLYNLDGSLYKTIQIPPKPDTAAYFFSICSISRTLFDNDSTNIEYLVSYQWGYSISGEPAHYNTKIVREDGTILLNESDATINYYQPLIYGTEEGTKMMLFYYHDSTSAYYQTKIFNLPGKLLSVPKEKILQTNIPILYPNPNNGTFNINFNTNNSIERNVNILNSEGKLIKSYKTSNNVLNINQPQLSEGMYLLNTSSKTESSTIKIVIKK